MMMLMLLIVTMMVITDHYVFFSSEWRIDELQLGDQGQPQKRTYPAEHWPSPKGKVA